MTGGECRPAGRSTFAAGWGCSAQAESSPDSTLTRRLLFAVHRSRLPKLQRLAPGREHNFIERLALPGREFALYEFLTAKGLGGVLITQSNGCGDLVVFRNLKQRPRLFAVHSAHLVGGHSQRRSLQNERGAGCS